MNETLLVAGYGSLLSGWGLLAARREGKGRLVAREAFPLTLSNARRGLAKPSGHGRYLAMDLEPVDPTGPIAGRVGGADGAGAIGALGLVFDRRWAEQIARREEYSPAIFLELIARADEAGQPLGHFLLEIARRTEYDLLAYRRALFAMLGYTSSGYVFHPLPLDDGRVAIVAIGSGFDGSGDPSVRSRRHECGMDRLLSLPEAMEVKNFDLDGEAQLGYLVECLLGGMHGLEVADLLRGIEPGSRPGELLARELGHAAADEHAHFLRATSLSAARYHELFNPVNARSLLAVLDFAGGVP